MGNVEIVRPDPDTEWCVGCEYADWDNSEYVSQFLMPDGRGKLIDLSQMKLPGCIKAVFLRSLGMPIPSKAIAITHIGRGPHSGDIVGISCLGACSEGEDCTGRNQ